MGRDEIVFSVKGMEFNELLNSLSKYGKKHFEEYWLYLYKVEFVKGFNGYKKGECAISLSGERYGMTGLKFLRQDNSDKEVQNHFEEYMGKIKFKWYGDLVCELGIDSFESQEKYMKITPLEWENGSLKTTN